MSLNSTCMYPKLTPLKFVLGTCTFVVYRGHAGNYLKQQQHEQEHWDIFPNFGMS